MQQNTRALRTDEIKIVTKQHVCRYAMLPLKSKIKHPLSIRQNENQQHSKFRSNKLKIIEMQKVTTWSENKSKAKESKLNSL